MLIPRFEYHRPADLDEALQLLDRQRAEAKLLAGGTDLLVNLKRRLVAPKSVVSISRLEGLDGLEKSDEGLRIGPLVTADRLARAAKDLGPASLLATAAGGLGTPLIRNLATVGGNLVTARPASDFAPPLLVLGAAVILASLKGERRVALHDFFEGPGQSVLKPEEILTAVLVPNLSPGSGGGYVKLGARRAMEISIVSAAAFLRLDEEGTIKEARVALGAVAPRPILADAAETLLIGDKPKGANDPIFHGAAAAAVADASPIDDFRASAEYRCLMIEVVTRQALGQAWLQAKGE